MQFVAINYIPGAISTHSYILSVPREWARLFLSCYVVLREMTAFLSTPHRENMLRLLSQEITKLKIRKGRTLSLNLSCESRKTSVRSRAVINDMSIMSLSKTGNDFNWPKMRGRAEGRKTVSIAFASGSPFLSMREPDTQVNFHGVIWPWRRTLTNGSDDKYAFPFGCTGCSATDLVADWLPQCMCSETRSVRAPCGPGPTRWSPCTAADQTRARTAGTPWSAVSRPVRCPPERRPCCSACCPLPVGRWNGIDSKSWMSFLSQLLGHSSERLATTRVVTLSLPSSKRTFSQPFKEKCISEVMRIGSIIIFHLSKLWKAKFFILCGVIFLVRLLGEFSLQSRRFLWVTDKSDCLSRHFGSCELRGYPGSLCCSHARLSRFPNPRWRPGSQRVLTNTPGLQAGGNLELITLHNCPAELTLAFRPPVLVPSGPDRHSSGCTTVPAPLPWPVGEECVTSLYRHTL